MGLVSLPVIVFLYWLMLHYKKADPFPARGVLRLILAGAAAALIARFMYTPIHSLAMLIYGPDAPAQTFLWNLLNTMLTAGLAEECFKFVTCRIAIIKEGMIRTWMDCVIAFSVVGITFEFIENMVYGMSSGVAGAAARAIAPGHFIFGVIMGYFYGKYRVTGQRKYLFLCYIVPAAFHTITNAFLQSAGLGRPYLIMALAAAASLFIAAVVSVIFVIRWQKNKKLDVPVMEK